MSCCLVLAQHFHHMVDRNRIVDFFQATTKNMEDTDVGDFGGFAGELYSSDLSLPTFLSTHGNQPGSTKQTSFIRQHVPRCENVGLGSRVRFVVRLGSRRLLRMFWPS